MPSKGVEAKPSETAFFAALRRAIAHKDYANEKFGPDHLAEYFLPVYFRFFLKFRKIRENTKEKLSKFLPGLNEMMIARTAYFDALFREALEKNFPQIVLLGAGYDTRAYRYADRNKGTRIIELDIAPTQNWKQKALKKAKIDIPESVTLAPINFNTESLADVLQKAGYDPAAQTLFIWEGVSYYLQADSVNATLAFVREGAHPESLIAFDYIVPLTDENRTAYGVVEFYKTMQQEHGNEALIFSIGEGEINNFLAERGLLLIEHLTNQEIETKFLTDGETLLGQMTANFRFVTAAPQK